MLHLDIYRVLNRKRIWLFVPALIVCAYLAYSDIAFDASDIPVTVRRWFPLNGAWNYWQPFATGIGWSVINTLIFLVVALPACDLFFEDRKSRVGISLLRNSSRREIATSHFVVAFCSGAIIVAIMLVLENLWIFTKVPMLPISQYYLPEFMRESILYPSFMLAHPLLYMGFTILRSSLFGGVLACFALSVNYWMKGAYAGLFVPYFIVNAGNMLWNFLIQLIGLPATFESELMIRFPISAESMRWMTKLHLGVIIGFCVLTYLHSCRNRDNLL